MRNVLWAMLGFMTLAVTSAVSVSPALARDYPFCIKGRDYGSSVGDCSFDTYAQCQASASGRYDFCDANPFYSYNEGPRRSRRHRHYRDYR